MVVRIDPLEFAVFKCDFLGNTNLYSVQHTPLWNTPVEICKYRFQHQPRRPRECNKVRILELIENSINVILN